MNALHAAKTAGATGLALLLGSTVWFGVRLLQPAVPPAPGADVFNDSGYVAQEIQPVRLPPVVWPKPRAQARGWAWTYEVFTPPEIFYDASTQSFRVTPLPDEVVPAAPPAGGFGLELLAVEPELFPLQLLGYVGEAGNCLGTFENTVTAETLLLRSGDRVQDLGLTVESVTIAREPVAIPESMSVNERRGSAVVRHDRTGQRTILRQGARCFTSRLRARVAVVGGPGGVREVGEGDVIEAGEVRFIIGKIRLAPPAVDVSKETSGHAGIESQTLGQRAADAMPAF